MGNITIEAKQMRVAIIFAIIAISLVGQNVKAPPLRIVTPFTAYSTPTQPYGIIVRAIGGYLPYRWSLAIPYPPGISLIQIGDNAVVIGANNLIGRVNFTLQVRDSHDNKPTELNVWFVKGA